MSDLLKLFQDLTHYNNELHRNNDDDIFKLLGVIENMQQKWSTSENELISSRRILTTYENDLALARVENKDLRIQLVEARSQIAGVSAAREELEKRNSILEQQMEMVRDLLRDEKILPEHRKKLQFLDYHSFDDELPPRNPMSMMTERDIDYDRTEDSAEDVLNGGRSSRTVNGNRPKGSVSLNRVIASAPGDDMDDQTPRKRSRDDLEIPNNNGNYGVGDHSGDNDHFRSPLNRSFSEPNNVGGYLQPSMAIRPVKSVADLAILSPATATGTGRRHTFISKSCLKVEYCNHCERRVNFASKFTRCEVCGFQCHDECRYFALLPCIAPGTASSKNQQGKLADYTPLDPPMVPNIIVHCVNEIERRGLTSVGLYRVPGSESQVADLLEKFLHRRGVPNLHQYVDINVLAGCIKKFLHSLREPVVPEASIVELINATTIQSKTGDGGPLQNAISEMPQPNRETLAFLMIHLQKVSNFSNENLMTIPNLVTIFAPTIVGRVSSATWEGAAVQMQKMEMIMKSLLELPPEFWGRFLSQSEQGPLFGRTAAGGMPRENMNQGMGTSLLGPINGETNTTPKSGTYKMRNNRKHFFNPPWK